ncbi:NADH-quinone oxidoreductase subunit L [Actinomadura sp. WMMB 499]|uniref:NADH-quinone oxidoreductase subunit 5 family protein n=1 Tax=Actinomadura sp. WMMB 499 TaxID=1219491 RepID=UPI001243B069|nr:NADH-quinone oxidoreductase subunit L [Actinomadura sp. WMMB 499]QFG23836.1 NADH-quinone oxidoreductase subunit L [Actinomadura sp. WMMB 499]
MILLASLTVLLPFAAALAGFLLGPRLTRALRGGTPPRSPLRNGPALIACVPAAAALVLAAIVAFTVWREPGTRTGALAVVDTGTVPIRVGLQVDGLSAVVALMVCCVALAVQVYSVVYLDGDRRYSSYAAFVSLFTSAMLLVVLAADLIVLYVGWEVMGICSYFLIGHHWEEREYSRAAVKAFLTTRLGDAGFLVGVIVLGVSAGSFELDDVLRSIGGLSETTLTVAALLLLAGVVGKSAQFPLHTWLPDAMAGPTPISALIHAATMVAAGVYVVARLFGVFAAAPAALAVLGVLAVISMVGAALAALAQDDLKRVLAYSTISQLGVMAAGLAVGAHTPAIFHLLSHGAFKALLFLAAGCVIVTTGTNMLARYGGLRHGMPITFWSATIGFGALAGVPPLSGWFSKDSVIEAAQHSALHGGTLYDEVRGPGLMVVGSVRLSETTGSPPHVPLTPAISDALLKLEPTYGQSIPTGIAWLVYLGLLLTVVLTAAYAARTWLMTFFGEPRGTHDVREPSKVMSWTVAALAVPAAILGFFGLGADELRPHLGSALLGAVLTALGAGAAFVVWNRDPALDPARALGPVRPVLARAFYLDELYAAAIVRPLRALARLVVTADARGIDTAVVETGRSARRIAGPLRVPQNGNPQTYLTGLVAGVVVIAAVVVIFQ